ncbi:MAG: hypothetical protein NVSMB64_30370 [Candidatus Velthaea sp.]
MHGPLGVKHLPRLWMKVLLHGCGYLPDGYRHGSGGFDELLLTTLGLESEAFVAYICKEKPDYLTLEAWVRAHAAKLDAESIATVNARVDTADLPEAMRVERFARFHITDPAYTKAVALNDLDDWAGMHEAITGAR